jgi:hypothetical protein
MWTLIILVISIGRPALTVVDGFPNEIVCEHAAKSAKADLEKLTVGVTVSCVDKKGLL